MNTPACPQCNYEFTYENNGIIICPECNHERSLTETNNEDLILDANNNPLSDGDSVIVIKDLKFKGGVVKK